MLGKRCSASAREERPPEGQWQEEDMDCFLETVSDMKVQEVFPASNQSSSAASTKSSNLETALSRTGASPERQRNISKIQVNLKRKITIPRYGLGLAGCIANPIIFNKHCLINLQTCKFM